MISINTLEDMFEGDKGIIKELFSLYLSENEFITQKIRLEYDNNNLTGLYNITHSLSGALGNLFEVDVIEQIKEIEILSRSHSKPNIEIIDSTIHGLNDISKQMNQYLT
jgi:hypothetical protein